MEDKKKLENVADGSGMWDLTDENIPASEIVDENEIPEINDDETTEPLPDDLPENDDLAAEELEAQKNVPLKKYVEEKHKRQELERKLAEHEELLSKFREKEADEEVEQYRKKIYQEYVDANYTEEIASKLANNFAELKKQILAKPEGESKYKIAINTLKQNEYYDNADVYATPIEENMKKYGISAKEAYNMIVDPAVRLKEIAQRQASKGKTSTPYTPNVSSNSAKAAPSKLTPEDQKALRQWQRSDPAGNWTEKTYIELMYRKK